mgnify:CR=1 FL=1
MNVPEIRFKEFCDYYSDVLLEKCLSVSNKKNNKLEYKKEDALSVSDEFGVVNQIEHLGRSYTGNNISTYKILNKWQIVYTKSPLKLKPFGIIKVNNNKPGIVSVLYAIYDVKEGFDPNYISVYFEPNFRLNKYLLPLINKGAKNTINISDETALSGEVHIPLSYTEQQKIASYFQSLDSLIQTTSKKLASLKRIKAASLQSMFPQEGETVPKVRFKGFEGEWEKIPFGSFLKESYERSTVENEDILLSSAITGVYLNSELFGHQRGASNIGYKKIKKNMLILSTQNLHLGNANVNLKFEHGLISPAYKVYEIVNISPLFLQQWIKMDSTKVFFLNATTAGASLCRKNIVWDDLYKQIVLIPSKNEQVKIGLFFSNLDKQISLQTQRLEKLKQIKAACLDKMFV